MLQCRDSKVQLDDVASPEVLALEVHKNHGLPWLTTFPLTPAEHSRR